MFKLHLPKNPSPLSPATWPTSATPTYRPIGLTTKNHESPTHEEKKVRKDVAWKIYENSEADRCDIDGQIPNLSVRMFWTLWLVGILVVMWCICFIIFPYQLVTSDFMVTACEIRWMIWLVNSWIAPCLRWWIHARLLRGNLEETGVWMIWNLLNKCLGYVWILCLYVYIYIHYTLYIYIISVMIICDSGDFIVISDGGSGVQGCWCGCQVCFRKHDGTPKSRWNWRLIQSMWFIDSKSM